LAAGGVDLQRDLHGRFKRMCSRVRLDAGCFDLLDKYYREPRRHYHGWRHIAECFAQFDLAEHLLGDPAAVELALWFHDAIYVVGSSRNELESAELACASIRPVDPGLADKVRQFIAATDYSRISSVDDPDLDYLKDIDFAAFGKPFEGFWQDVERLRRENGEDNQPAASVRRLAFYREILDGRVELFRTDFFRDRLLGQALRNVEQAVARLEQAGD